MSADAQGATLKSLSASAWSLSGEVTTLNAVALRQEGERLLSAAETQVVVDLAGISRSTSAAISVLLCWMREGERLNKKLQFANMPDKMFDVARVSGLDAVLPCIE